MFGLAILIKVAPVYTALLLILLKPDYYNWRAAHQHVIVFECVY